MDANNLGAAAPTLDPETLKPRDAAFDETLKEVFSDLTRRRSTRPREKNETRD